MSHESVIERVLAHERRRASAVVARDVAALQDLVREELVYVHATGVRHDKAGWLSFVASGPRFGAVQFELRQAIEAGPSSVLLHGELGLHILRPGEDVAVPLRSWASALWSRDAQDRWRLHLFHSTRQSE